LPRQGDYVFAGRNGAIHGHSRSKTRLDKDSGVTGWRLHDLRRTARSLMSRAGVLSDHAELCLGHVLPGIRGTYDQYDYMDEKREAFEKLAALVRKIVGGNQRPASSLSPSRCYRRHPPAPNGNAMASSRRAEPASEASATQRRPSSTARPIAMTRDAGGSGARDLAGHVAAVADWRLGSRR
jgi:hypothetical protein